MRVDGAAPRGLWPPAGGGLHRFAQGATALRAEGGSSGFAIGHALGVRVHRVQRVQKVQRVVVAADAANFKEKGGGSAAGCVEGLHRFAQGATALRAEGGSSGFAIGHALGVRVHRVQRVQKVQRVVVAADAANFKEKGGGSAAGCVEGLHRFAQGATTALPLRVADCRSVAMLIKSALRD